jgi:hypothetical protein
VIGATGAVDFDGLGAGVEIARAACPVVGAAVCSAGFAVVGGGWGGLKIMNQPTYTIRHNTSARSERISIDISLSFGSLTNAPLQ